MSNEPIPFGKPMLDASEIDAVTKVLSGTQLVHGPVTKAFEEAFAARAGAKYAVSVSSCTAALHLSLLVNGIGPGDEVIVPAMTHVATAHAVEFCGGKPVFADVEADSGNIDAEKIEAAITPRTKAILPVHYLGLPCDMDKINALAKKTGAFVIEDCALAVDATYDGNKAGTLSLAGCFSFYPVKHITTGEGGMVTTDDEQLAADITQNKAFGYDRALGQRAKPGIYDVTVLGYNYRMNEVEAAIGLCQLEKLDSHQEHRRRNYDALKESLSDIAELTIFPSTHGKSRSTHYCLNVVLPRDGHIDRDHVVAALREKGVGTSVHYPCAVPLMTYYRNKYGYALGDFPVAEWIAAQTISLPTAPHIDNDDVHRIGRAVRQAVVEARR